MLYKYISLFVACPSIFLIVSYKEQRFYILMKSNILLTFFIVHDFCILFKTLRLPQNILLNFFPKTKDDCFFLPQTGIQIVTAWVVERLSFVCGITLVSSSKSIDHIWLGLFEDVLYSSNDLYTSLTSLYTNLTLSWLLEIENKSPNQVV